MPKIEWDDILEAAAGEVLETMFFTAVYGPAASAAESPSVAARLRFEGTPSGVLTVNISEPAMHTLAANFLACEEEGPLSPPQLGSVACELANMVCGSLLSHVKTEEHFCLSSPELLPQNDVAQAGSPNRSLDLGDGVIDLWLALEHHAG
jgi:hypothetical protein